MDDDLRTRRALERVLGRRFGGDYRILGAPSGQAALDQLREVSESGGETALVLADQWMPGLTGIDLLALTRDLQPRARRILLIDYGDRSCQRPILQAMALGHIEHFLPKDATFPEQWLYPSVSEYLSAWSRSRGGFEAVRVVGDQWSPRSHELREKLGRNGVPYGFYAADSEPGRRLLRGAGLDASRLPVVLHIGGSVLVDPTDVEVAQACGVKTSPQREQYDLAIVGGGPAGLAAAVSAASEGLSTAVLEPYSIGGQASASALIRNYLGFPRGLSGADLTVRAYEQAWVFGVDFVFMREATGLCARDGRLEIALSGGGDVMRARAALIATGMSYRRLEVPGLAALEGAGVFYGAAAGEAPAMQGLTVYVAGAGNSAGQAALHLARHARRVEMVVRGPELGRTMSDYLVKEIASARNVTVQTSTVIVEGHGVRRLEGLTLRNLSSGQETTVPTEALFVLIGGDPHTEWLAGTVQRHERGFVLTGRDLRPEGRPPWPLDRSPLARETSFPGVFAAGDVRFGSVKRMASAVGEGAQVVQQVHEYLAG